MEKNLYKLHSRPDDIAVIYVKATDKKEALKRINETGGYQDHFFEPDGYDYSIRKCKTFKHACPWGTEFILDDGTRVTLGDFRKTIMEKM